MTRKPDRPQKASKKHKRLILNGYFLTSDKNIEKRCFFLENSKLLESFEEVVILERSNALAPPDTFRPARYLRNARKLPKQYIDKGIKIIPRYRSRLRSKKRAISADNSSLTRKIYSKAKYAKRMLIHGFKSGSRRLNHVIKRIKNRIRRLTNRIARVIKHFYRRFLRPFVRPLWRVISRNVKRIRSKRIPLRLRLLVHRLYFASKVSLMSNRNWSGVKSVFSQAAKRHKGLVQRKYFLESTYPADFGEPGDLKVQQLAANSQTTDGDYPSVATTQASKSDSNILSPATGTIARQAGNFRSQQINANNTNLLYEQPSQEECHAPLSDQVGSVDTDGANSSESFQQTATIEKAQRSTLSKALENVPQSCECHYFPNELSSGACSIWAMAKGMLHIVSKPKYKCWGDVCALEREILNGSSMFWKYFAGKILTLGSLNYINKMLFDLELDESDVVIIFSEHSSGARILLEEARSAGCRVLLSEYGELPGTFFVSERGMFHESWPSENQTRFNQFEISDTDLDRVEATLDDIVSKRTSTKSYDSESSPLLKNTENFDAVIYVNGVQPFMSGLYPRRADFSKEYSPFFSSNIELLSAVADIAKKNNWLVLYKDHPNIVRVMPKACISKNHWGDHVRILDNVNVYDVFSVSDVVVSLGSKSVFLSLACGVPVVLSGPYSIDSNILEWGLEEMSKNKRPKDALEDSLKKVISSTQERIDRQGLVNYLARMMRYDLYEYDDNGDFRRGKSKFAADLKGLLENTRSSLTDIPNILKFPENAKFHQLWHLQTDSSKWQIYSEDEIACLRDLFKRLNPKSIVDWGCGLGRSAVGFSIAYELHDVSWELCDLTGKEVSKWVDEEGNKIGKGMGTFDHSDPLPYNDLDLTRQFCELNGMKNFEVVDINSKRDLGSSDLIYSLHCVGYHFSIKAFLEKLHGMPKTMIFGIRRKKLEGTYNVVDIDSIPGYKKSLIRGSVLQDFLVFER